MSLHDPGPNILEIYSIPFASHVQESVFCLHRYVVIVLTSIKKRMNHKYFMILFSEAGKNLSESIHNPPSTSQYSI